MASHKKTKKPTPKSTTLTRLTADSKPAVVIAHLKAKYPALTDVDRAGFDSLISDAERSGLGKKTKAVNVLDNASSWAVEIDKQLALYPAALTEYSPERFAYFLDRAARLESTINKETKKSTQVVESRLGEDDARKTAVDLRSDMLARMNRFAGRRAAELNALASNQGVIEGDGLRTSMINLCDLAQSWLDRKDSINVQLLKHAGISKDTVDAARRAASAIGSAGGNAALQGNKVARDTPLVNLDEGGLLFEMLDVMDVFERAAARTNVVQRLVPNKSIRHVFIHPTGKKAGTPPVDAPPPPSAPSATNATTRAQTA